MTRPRTLAATLGALLLFLGPVGCGGDDDSGATTTTEAGSAATSSPDGAETSDGPGTTQGDGGGPTTAPPDGAPTTSPNLTPSDSPLADRLLDPAAVGEGFAPDDTLGTGTFDGDLCEDVTIDPTWDDQAGQGLSRAEPDGGLTTFTQAVLSFADDGAAEGFMTALHEGETTCLGAESTDVDEGDGAFLVAVSDEEGSSAAAAVRIGSRVTTVITLGPTDPGPVDEALVAAAASAIGA